MSYSEIRHRLEPTLPKWRSSYPEVRLQITQEGSVLVVRRWLMFLDSSLCQHTITTEDVDSLILKGSEELNGGGVRAIV